MKISDIISKEECCFANADFNTEFNRLTTDKSKIGNRDILIITPSGESSGLSNIPAMPLAVICGENVILPDNITQIVVKDIRKTIANSFFKYEKISLKKTKLIAVTGTNGKTSTASMIKAILSKSGIKVGFIGTGKIEIGSETISEKNYSMTTPQPSLLYSSIRKMQENGCGAIVMEISSHALAQDRAYPLEFDWGVFTNLSAEHMDYHFGMEDYFKTKMKLFKNTKRAVINVDGRYGCRAFSEINTSKISVGALYKADVYVDEVENLGFDGVRYRLNGKYGQVSVNLSLPGIYNVYNSALAAAVCLDYGIDKGTVSSALAKITQVPGRFEIIKGDVTVIIDYAHTAEAFESVLREISRMKKGRKLTVVFGCGGERDRKKRPMMAMSAERYADRIILTSDNSRSEPTERIIEDIERGFTKSNHEALISREKAITKAILTSEVGDLIAIIGKGDERYNIDKDGYHYFNEKEIIFSALKRREET